MKGNITFNLNINKKVGAVLLAAASLFAAAEYVSLIDAKSSGGIIVQNESVPIGTIAMWGTSTPPTGWIEMKGQSVSAYPELAKIYGATIPDMRGQFARGWDNSAGIDSGRTLNSVQTSQMAKHYHGMGRFSSTGNDDGYLIKGAWNDGNSYSSRWIAGEAGSVNTLTANGKDAAPLRTSLQSLNETGETRPTNVALMYIIKAE